MHMPRKNHNDKVVVADFVCSHCKVLDCCVGGQGFKV